MKTLDLHVAVSGFGGLNNPHPGTPVARALRQGWRGPIEIHALGYDSLMTGAWMPGVADRLHVVPSLADGDEATFERLLEIHRQHRLDAVIPCLDLELPVYARLAERLARAGIKTLVPSAEAVYATAKLRLPRFAHENDILTPKTIHVLDMGDVALHAEQFGFPLMIKGTVTGAKRVTNVDQACAEAKSLNARWGGGVLLQDALAGEEFVVGAVIAGSGSCLGLVCMRKLGVNPDGKGVFGSVVDDPEIVREAESILGKLAWRGPLELEFIRPPGAKRLHLLEINCRFPSWIMLSHFAGCNLPVVLLREVLEPGARRSPPPKPGTMFVRNVRETAVPMDRVARLERFATEDGVPPLRRRNRPGVNGAIRVAVTGVGTFDVINPGLGAATALRGASEVGRIYGLGYGSFDSGLYRGDVFDAVFRLPQEDDAGALLDRLRAIHKDAPFDVILPCMDGELSRFLDIRPDLEGLGVRTLLPSREALDGRAKPNLFTGDMRRDWGAFEIPETFRVRSEEDVERAVHSLGLPVVVKGPVSECIAAHDAGEAIAAWFQLREKGCDEALVQPLITGDDFAVAAVCGRDHEPGAMLTVKKLLKCDRGSTWAAVNAPQPALEAAFADFLRDLGWCGPTEGEFIRDETRERFYLIEVNPRFTAWISFSAALGLNHPLRAVCLALDRPCPPPSAQSEMVFMRSCEELPVSARDFAAIAKKGFLRHG